MRKMNKKIGQISCVTAILLAVLLFSMLLVGPAFSVTDPSPTPQWTQDTEGNDLQVDEEGEDLGALSELIRIGYDENLTSPTISAPGYTDPQDAGDVAIFNFGDADVWVKTILDAGWDVTNDDPRAGDFAFMSDDSGTSYYWSYLRVYTNTSSTITLGNQTLEGGIKNNTGITHFGVFVVYDYYDENDWTLSGAAPTQGPSATGQDFGEAKFIFFGVKPSTNSVYFSTNETTGSHDAAKEGNSTICTWETIDSISILNFSGCTAHAAGALVGFDNSRADVDDFEHRFYKAAGDIYVKLKIVAIDGSGTYVDFAYVYDDTGDRVEAYMLDEARSADDQNTDYSQNRGQNPDTPGDGGLGPSQDSKFGMYYVVPLGAPADGDKYYYDYGTRNFTLADESYETKITLTAVSTCPDQEP